MSTDRNHLTPKQITDKNGRRTTVLVNDQKDSATANADRLGSVSPSSVLRPQRPLRTVIDMYGDVIDDNQVVSKGDDVLTAEGYEVAYEDSYAKILPEGESVRYEDEEFLSRIEAEPGGLHSVSVTRLEGDEAHLARIDVEHSENMLWREDDDGNNVDGLSEDYLNDNYQHVDSFFRERYNAEVGGSEWDNTSITMEKTVPADTLTESRLVEHAYNINAKFVNESDPGTYGSEYYVPKMKEHIEQKHEEERQYHRDRYNARPVSADQMNEALGTGTPVSSFGDGHVGESTSPFGGSYSMIADEDGNYQLDENQLEGWEPVTGGRTGQFGYSGPVMHDSESIGEGLGQDILDTPGNYVLMPAEYYDGKSFDSETEGWVILKEKGSEEEFKEMGFE